MPITPLRVGVGIGPSGVLTVPHLFPIVSPATLSGHIDYQLAEHWLLEVAIATEVIIPMAVLVPFSSIRGAARAKLAWISSGPLRWSLGPTVQIGANLPLFFAASFLGLPFPNYGGDVISTVGPALDAQVGIAGALEYDLSDHIVLVAEVPLYVGAWWSLLVVSSYPNVGIRFRL